MKIAYYVGNFPILSQTFILNQIAGMLGRGHEIDIYARKPVEDPRACEEISKLGLAGRVRYIPSIPRNYLLRLLKAGGLALSGKGWRRPIPLCRALNAKAYGDYASSLRLFYAALPPLEHPSYDVIHAQFGPLGLKALALRQIGAIDGKLITSFRGFDATRRLRDHPALYAELFRKGDLFLPVSRSLRQRLIENGCDEKKIVVHHSGIDCSKFRFSSRGRGSGKETKIISVSRLVEKKGISHAVRAVALLAASGRKVTYSVVGDGELRTELERMISELGVGDQVKLLGWKSHDEVIRLLEESDILAAPSLTAEDGDQEGIPNAAKEAMALGMPVLGTLHGGIPELVEDGVSGFLVPERDVEALADRLAYLHDHPETWAEMGKEGRSRIEKEYEIEKLNDELVELYGSPSSAELGE